MISLTEDLQEFESAVVRLAAAHAEVSQAKKALAAVATRIGNCLAESEDAISPAPGWNGAATPTDGPLRESDLAAAHEKAKADRREKDRKRREDKKAAAANGQAAGSGAEALPIPPRPSVGPPPRGRQVLPGDAGVEDARPEGLPAVVEEFTPSPTSDELETELLHALGRSPICNDGVEMGLSWQPLIEHGASDGQIGAKLASIWPRSRQFVPPTHSGGKHGYTAQASGIRTAAFWVGACSGSTHTPSLRDVDLFRRIRSVLEIPTPAEARQLAAPAPVTGAAGGGLFAKPPRRSTGELVPWTPQSLKTAAKAIGCPSDKAVICQGCSTLRNVKDSPCPACQSPSYRFAAIPPDPVEGPRRGRKAVTT